MNARVGILIRLASYSAIGLVCLIVILADAVQRPYPLLSDLDSSFVSFLHFASAFDKRAGSDYIFTYGPLGSWYLPMSLDERWVFGNILRLSSGFALLWFLWSQARSIIGAAISVISIFVIFIDSNALILATALALGFCIARKRITNVFLFSVLTTLWGLIKYSGMVTFFLVVIFSVILSLLFRARSGSEVTRVLGAAAIAHCLVVGLVYIAYLDQDLIHYVEYMTSSFTISSGYSQFMGVGDRPSLLFGFFLAALAMFGAHAYCLWRETADDHYFDWPWVRFQSMILPLFNSVPVLFIAMKQGFIRQDGHEVAAFLTLFFYGTVIILNFMNRDLRAVTLHATFAAITVILVSSITMRGVEPGLAMIQQRIATEWRRAASNLSLLGSHQRSILQENIDAATTATLKQFSRDFPFLAKYRSFDIFSPEQSFALLNPTSYAPRPVFQGYSAYTSSLQDLNAAHAASIPSEFMVGLHPVIDGRWPNLEDGSTLAQILFNFCPIDWSGMRVGFQRRTHASAAVPFQQVDWQQRPLNGFRPDSDTVIGHIDIKLTILGQLISAVYRLPPINARVELSDNTTQDVRLIPTGKRYPALLSPWIGSAWDISTLWSNQGTRSVREIKTTLSGYQNLLVSDIEFRYATIARSEITSKCDISSSNLFVLPSGSPIVQFPKGQHSIRDADAHPNKALVVHVDSLSHVKATIALRDPKAVFSKSNGVEVRVYHLNEGHETVLFESRIAPDQLDGSAHRVVLDRSVTLGTGYVVFETRDSDPRWDWYVWSAIELQ